MGGRRAGLTDSTRPRAQGLLPGEEITLGKCLRFSVRGFSDRSGPLSHADWVNVRVRNQCPNLRRHLLVALVLIDPQGASYGGPLWLLERGEILPPGGTKTGNFPLPDTQDRMPVRWAARLLKVQRPRPPQARALAHANTRPAPSRSRVARERPQRPSRPASRLTAPARRKTPSRTAPPARHVGDKKVLMSPSPLPFIAKTNHAKAKQPGASSVARRGIHPPARTARKSTARKSTSLRGQRRPGKDAKKKWWQ